MSAGVKGRTPHSDRHAMGGSEIGSEERLRWTPRVSREFIDYLRSQLHEDGKRRFADRTVNRGGGRR